MNDLRSYPKLPRLQLRTFPGNYTTNLLIPPPHTHTSEALSFRFTTANTALVTSLPEPAHSPSLSTSLDVTVDPGHRVEGLSPVSDTLQLEMHSPNSCKSLLSVLSVQISFFLQPEHAVSTQRHGPGHVCKHSFTFIPSSPLSIGAQASSGVYNLNHPPQEHRLAQECTI